MAYQLKGRMLEVCTCETVCPCFIGEAPDGGSCDVTVAWQFDRGTIEDVDVTGCTIAVIAHIPGKPLDGNWRAAVYVDDGATEAQETAILNVFTGKLGGAIADVASLIGEVVSVERTSITFTAKNGKGSLKIGDVADAEMEPYVTLTPYFRERQGHRPYSAARRTIVPSMIRWASTSTLRVTAPWSAVLAFRVSVITTCMESRLN
jgi:hypothetical protein